MLRGIVMTGALAAAAAATVFAVQVNAAPAGATSIGQWEAGRNYVELRTPQPPPGKRGKVEVNEVFWYGCSHCFALDPALESWKASKPGFIEFVRTPVVWGPFHRQHARLYYTLLALKRADLHPKVFETIHRGGNSLGAQTDVEARALHLAFLKENGVTEKDFNAAYDAPEVEASIKRAQSLSGRYEIASVPTLIVNGTYSTSVSQAGGTSELLTLITDLAKSEKQR